MTDKIHLDIQDHIATITLNRSDKLNALDPEMLLGLEATATRLDADQQIRVVLITGAGDRAFCVGADIHAWAALEPLDMWRRWIRDGHRVFDRLAHLRQPLIAVLNGYTFGGGLELALTADLRLAAEHVEVALPEVKIGTVPGWGGTQRLPDLIGTGRAKQMIFSGGRIDARTAEQWGLLNEVHPAGDLMEAAHSLARTIAENAPLSVQIAKQAVDARAGSSTIEALAGALAASSEDGKEGVAAFRERRPPQFQGR